MAVQSRNSAAYKTDLTRTQAKDLRTTFFKLFLNKFFYHLKRLLNGQQ